MITMFYTVYYMMLKLKCVFWKTDMTCDAVKVTK